MEHTNCNNTGFGSASCEEPFDFTLPFEQSILSIGPSAIFLLLVPARLLQLHGTNNKTCTSGIPSVWKTIVTGIYTVLQLILVVLWSTRASNLNQESIPSAVLSLLDAVAIVVLSLVEQFKSVRPSFLINVYLLLSIIFDAAQIRTLFLIHEATSISAIMSASVIMKIILLVFEVQNKRNILKNPYRNYPPEVLSGVISWSFLWWLKDLFILGFRKVMTLDDLYRIDEALTSEVIAPRMQEAWQLRSKEREKYSLLWATAYCLRWELISAVFPRLCLIGFSYTQPFLITRAIKLLMEPESQASMNTGYGLIGATFLIYFGIAMSTIHYKQRYFRTLVMFRGALVSLIFNRALTLQDGAQDDSGALTLMSTDVDSITQAVIEINDIWACIIELGIGIWLLERQVGVVCVAPIFLVLVSTYGQGWVAKRVDGRQTVWNSAIQKRVATTSSMLNSMKAVKMMGLSNTLAKTVQDQRVEELERSKSFMWMIVIINCINDFPRIWSPVLTFIAFAIKAKVQGTGALETVEAFTALAIISLVTSPASKLLGTIPLTAAATGCFRRIQKYLLLPIRVDHRLELIPSNAFTNYPPLSFSNFSPKHESSSGDERVEIELVNMRASKPRTSWQKTYTAIRFTNITVRREQTIKPVIKDVTFQVPASALLLIVGPSGSGKSTIIKTLLGELSYESGDVTVSTKKIGYCSQRTWLLNTSIRESIYGLSAAPKSGDGVGDAIEDENRHHKSPDFDEVWYKTVVHACVLEQDIVQLPEGDQSIIGSQGLTLSGGQKQRLALARAVYAKKEIIILDDVLSALDRKTETTLVSRLLGVDGLFRKLGTTVVLVTHTTRHLSLADQILVLGSDGCISQLGTYEALSHQEGYLKDIISHRRDIDHERDSPALEVHMVPVPKPNDLLDLTRKGSDFSTYAYYAKSIGKSLCIGFLLTNAAAAFALNFPQVWLQRWTNIGGGEFAMYLSVYVVLAASASFLSGVYIWITFVKIQPKSSARLHKLLLDSVMRAPQSFFAQTDTGVTLNRFSQDMTLIDMDVPGGLATTTLGFFNCLAAAALISTGSSYMAIILPFLFLILYFIQKIYLKTSRQLRLLDLETKSPIYTHFLETLDGLTTIRAFGWEDISSEISNSRLNASQQPVYLLYCIQRWLNLVLDLVVTALAVIVMALAVSLRSTTNGGLLGISLNNILSFGLTLSGLVTSWTTLETSLGAISRTKTFIATTASEHKPNEDIIPVSNWPSQGNIELKNISAKYNESSTSFALRDVNITIKGGQKILICGRTGSGKSSLLLALLRILDLETGSIVIDGIDLATIPREEIRQRFATISQDPFLLSGSVRLNLDPRSMVGDDQAIVEALKKVRLWEKICGSDIGDGDIGKLDEDMTAHPLSQGEEQLFGLARALLSQSRVVILDEATSSVDSGTDRLMQKILREEFEGRTVVTVAHRLDTIMDFDRILVMSEGRFVEYDTPTNLLARDGPFREIYGK